MKKILSVALMALIGMTAYAVPALRGKVMLQQPDGSKLEAIVGGDEALSFYTSASTGMRLTQEADGTWREMTSLELQASNAEWETNRMQFGIPAGSALTALGGHQPEGMHRMGGTSPIGVCHLPIILVAFKDMPFTLGTNEAFQHLLNDLDYRDVIYSRNGVDYCGYSARSYYRDQSFGQFDPTFDIIGPVTLSGNYADYGRHSGSANDINARGAFKEAIDLVVAQGLIPDASIYDGNGDKKIDLVYFIYAGLGENEVGLHGDLNTIWPHNSSSLGKTMGDYIVSEYVCSAELTFGLKDESGNYYKHLNGIGTTVHEFGHALGLPDFYCVGAEGSTYGMDAYSIMDQAPYAGKGFIPSSFNLFERESLGWSQAEPLPQYGEVELEPVSQTGKGYVVVNPKNSDERLYLEFHCHDGKWDECWSGGVYSSYPNRQGMLITHVDYSKSVWSSNKVNSDKSHMRCFPLAADGVLIPYGDFEKGVVDQNTWYTSYRNDYFPGETQPVTTLSPSANPMCYWFTTDENGAPDPIDIEILNITVDLAQGKCILQLPADPSTSVIEHKESSPLGKAQLRCLDGHMVIETADGQVSLTGCRR